MKRLALLLAACAVASPAAAQHDHHSASAEDPHAGHHPDQAPEQPGPHAGHGMQEADPHAVYSATEEHHPGPHAGHQMHTSGAHHRGHGDHHGPSEPQPDPHAAHRMSERVQEDPHAGHDMRHTAVDPPVAPPGPEAFSGPEHAADSYYGHSAMAQSRNEMYRMHGAVPAYRVLVDRLEAQLRDGRDAYVLDAEAWYGGDIDKLWLKAETHGEFGGEFEGAELQALWSHAIGPFFDMRAGVRLDALPGPDRGHLVVGVQGLAPYWIEVEASAFLSDRGDLTGSIEAEHDVRITQQLILQPRLEADFALQDIPSQLTGAGLSEIAAGARLRYQITQLFAPYVGLEYERAFGDTRRLRRAADEDPGGLSLLAGLRFWF